MTVAHDLSLARAARAEFLTAPRVAPELARDLGVRDVVAASWVRSRTAGVDADEYRISYHDDVDLDSRLVRCARPVIARLADEMVDVPVAIALSDAHARIVHRLDCATSVARPLDRVDFHRGFSFAEDGVGTNGIGTVFEAGRSVAVVGAEHFTEALTPFACTGAPIVDPVTGRMEGVLDVSSLAESWTPLMHTLVRRAAADIGENLLLDRGRATQALFETFVRACGRPSQAVMAVGDTLMVNQRAQQLFGPAEQLAIQQHARFLMGRRDRVRETLRLTGGRAVRLRATRILAGDEVAGIVLLLDDETVRDRPAGFAAATRPRGPAGRAAPGPRRPDGVPPAGPVSPAWLAADAEVRDALARGAGLLVLGEPGTGKATLVADAFGRLRPGARVLVTDAAHAPAAPADAALVVLRRLDRLAPAQADAVAARVDALRTTGTLVAATLDADAPAPAAALLAAFEQSVTVPPLRFRPDDVPRVVERLLAELAPERSVRLDADAVRVVTRYAWPGNLTEMRAALASAMRRRPVGTVRAGDLPAACRTAPKRTLSALETAERDAIVRVLAECDGNRMRAAAALGLSRSSLYRKLRAYAITG